MQFLAFNVNCCMYYNDYIDYIEKFNRLYLDQNDVINTLREVKIPTKITKKGIMRATETTIIGLSQAEKQRGVIGKPKPFSKLSPLQKDRVILECFPNKVNVVAAIDALRLLSIDDLFKFNVIPNIACDENIHFDLLIG